MLTRNQGRNKQLYDHLAWKGQAGGNGPLLKDCTSVYSAIFEGVNPIP